MILTGPEIARAVAEGEIHIDDFDPARLEPNSYGFRLAPRLLSYDRGTLDSRRAPDCTGITMDAAGHVLEPGRFYLGSTMEVMGSPHYAATLYACRSVSTLGVWIQFSAPLGHSGALFPWTLEITVANPVRLYPGMCIGKLAFWAMRGEPLLYDGKYTGSTAAVASRLSEDLTAVPPTKGN
ncbi:dCTP deaminase domain-containing protein [Streptomyces sp. NPDC091279]|uniref:dCTP deaminase n=1 Tax=unclassified Streptomyces TaxID=2593676 RepID=UPI00382C1722